jgi:predicted lysophospholipase L1 biosynthesis ABC-type transport system permease subunit
MSEESEGKDSRDSLLSLRVTTIMLLATLSGVAAGVLTYLSGQPTATAILLGLGVGAGAVKFFDWLIA